jgi:hypothetical protein
VAAAAAEAAAAQPGMTFPAMLLLASGGHNMLVSLACRQLQPCDSKLLCCLTQSHRIILLWGVVFVCLCWTLTIPCCCPQLKAAVMLLGLGRHCARHHH